MRPWLAIPPEIGIRSVSARYLLVGKSLDVLKRWKTGSGAAFERRVLRPDDAHLASSIAAPLRESLSPAYRHPREAIEIIPVGQDPARAWRLGGGPAERIARWLSLESGIPCSKALHASPRSTRQGELDRWQRFSQAPRFTPFRSVAPKVILVDDFMTTGRTIEAAGRALAQAGALEIHVFCLGLRPSFSGGGAFDASGTKADQETDDASGSRGVLGSADSRIASPGSERT